jgi:hypothetical protein
MLRYFLVLSLVLPLSGYCQTYATSPFYQLVSAIPTTAHAEGYQHGTIRANGIVIDLSEWVPSASPDFKQIAGWSVDVDLDRNARGQILHYYIQYDRLNESRRGERGGVTFGYDLLAEPEGSDQIRCTFSPYTDTSPSTRNQEIVPVAFPADLTPVVIHSGDVLAIKTLPLGPGRIADVHYIQLTRSDRPSDPAP